MSSFQVSQAKDEPTPNGEPSERKANVAPNGREQPLIQKAAAPVFVLPDHLNVMAVGFDHAGKNLVGVSITREVTIRTWDVVEKKLKTEARLETDQHYNSFLHSHLAVSADGQRVIGINGKQVGIWDTTTGKLVQSLVLPATMTHAGMSCLACTPDLTRIACGLTSNGSGVGSPDSYAVVWDVASGEVLRTVTHENTVQATSVGLSSDGKWLATGGQRGGTCLWEVSTGKLVHSLPNANDGLKHPDPEVSAEAANQVVCLAFSPDGKQLAIGDLLGVKLVDPQSGKLLHRMDSSYRFGRSGLLFSNDSQLVTRVGTDKIVPIWSAETGKLLAELPTESSGADFSDDGRWFAVGFSDEKNAISVWKLRDGVVPGEGADPNAKTEPALQEGAVPGGAADPAPAAAETLVPGPTDLDSEERTRAETMFANVKDLSPLKVREMPAYYRLLRWVRDQSYLDLDRRAERDVPFNSFNTQPDKYRGRLVSLRLKIRRILEFETPDNPLSVKRVYEAWGSADESKPFPFVVVFTELPKGMKVGPDVDEEGVFVGYFLKNLSFKAFDMNRSAPLLVGRLTNLPKSAP